MRILAVGAFLLLGACGGGGTTGTNYSEAPPVAEVVATPTPAPSLTPTPEPEETVTANDATANVEVE